MATDVGGDERAARDDRESAPAGVVQDGAREPAAEALALVAPPDLGVDEGDALTG